MRIDDDIGISARPAPRGDRQSAVYPRRARVPWACVGDRRSRSPRRPPEQSLSFRSRCVKRVRHGRSRLLRRYTASMMAFICGRPRTRPRSCNRRPYDGPHFRSPRAHVRRIAGHNSCPAVTRAFAFGNSGTIRRSSSSAKCSAPDSAMPYRARTRA